MENLRKLARLPTKLNDQEGQLDHIDEVQHSSYKTVSMRLFLFKLAIISCNFILSMSGNSMGHRSVAYERQLPL